MRRTHQALRRLPLVFGLAFIAGKAPAHTLPEGPGKELVETICSACHSVSLVAKQQKTKAEWQSLVATMLNGDDSVKAADRETIADYLAACFPKPAGKVNVNKAPAKDLEIALELSRQDAEAIVRYRMENGYFHTRDDLKKVPGLDTAKVESRKELLKF